MPRTDDGGRDVSALGRRSFLAAVGVAVGGVVPASARVEDARGSGSDPVEVEVQLKVGAFDRYRRGLIPVGLRLPEAVDREAVDAGSLRFGPPRVVEDGGGARPVDRQDEAPVFYFPSSEAGFRFGDTTARLVGRTEDGRGLVGETGVPTGGLLDGLV